MWWTEPLPFGLKTVVGGPSLFAPRTLLRTAPLERVEVTTMASEVPMAVFYPVSVAWNDFGWILGHPTVREG